MRYQNPTRPLAPVAPLHFQEAVIAAAGVALTALTLSDVRRRRMYELRGHRERYQFLQLDELLEALAEVPEESGALMFVEDLRSAIMARRRRNERRQRGAIEDDVASAVTADTIAQAEADPLQLVVAINPAAPLECLALARTATLRQLAVIRRLADALSAAIFRRAHMGRPA